MILLLTSSSSMVFAQKYSLAEAKNTKKAKETLGHGKPFLRMGKGKASDNTIITSGSENLSLGQKKACQYAAIKALSKLKKKAAQKQYPIVKNIHSENARHGFFYCHIGFRSATVKLSGTFSKR